MAKLEVLVVGLQDSFRGLALIDQLDAAGISWSHIWGVRAESHHRNLVAAEKVALVRVQELTFGEIGCALAHKRALAVACAADADAVLVLEDDILLSIDPQLLLGLDAISSHEPRIVNLFTHPETVLPKIGVRIEHRWGAGNYSEFQSLSVPTSTRAYLLNRAALSALHGLADSDLVTGAADYPPEFADWVKFWVVWPPIAQDNDSSSLIGTRDAAPGYVYRLWIDFVLLPYRWLLSSQKPRFLSLARTVHARRIGALLFRLRLTPLIFHNFKIRRGVARDV